MADAMTISLNNYILDAVAPTVPSRGAPLPNADGTRRRKPDWIRAPLPNGPGYLRMRSIVDEHGLHTVCQSAACPNMGECWSRGAATFMILGNICTRNCGFCNVSTGKPLPPDPSEPRRVAEAIRLMKVKYAVITCVDRDDLADKGSSHWADVIAEIRLASPRTIVETLIGDLSGENLRRVLEAGLGARGARVVSNPDQPLTPDGRSLPNPAPGPDVLAHNLECVPRISRLVRPQSKHERSVRTLIEAKQAGFVTKTGLMLGLGESPDEVKDTIREAVDAGVDILTLGQYLQPSHQHLRVERWVHPSEFEMLKQFAIDAGIKACEAGPMVRSSYYAENTGQDVLRLLGRA